jgi:septal ring factor EnvC (AmiA/AmiB activator)
MPSYSILMMRTDATDKRPWRFTIHRGLFWFMMLLAIGLPILGFFISFGWIAPNWLQMNMTSMRAEVKEAEASLQPLQQQNAQLAERKAALETQVNTMRAALAEATTKATMAETARTTATERMTQLEAEVITLKQSVAKYEAMLKPKSGAAREILQCNDLEVQLAGTTVKYGTSFSKVRREATIPARLTVQVKLAAGDNAMALEQAKQTGPLQNHTLEMTKNPRVNGQIALTGQVGGMRMLELRILNGAQQVGYCWKSF